MAGDWIKVEINLPDKPEVCQLADLLGLDQDTVVGKLIRFWRWSNLHSVNGKDLGVTDSFLDRLTNCPGFSAALITVGWLMERNGTLSIPRFDRHNSQTAKARALTKDRVKRSRNAPNVTPPLPEKTRGEREEDERKTPRISKGDRNTNGSSSDHSNQSSHSPEKVQTGKAETPLDLSGVDWDHVIAMAEKTAGKIKPRTTEDRRAWLRFAVLADMTFGEHWLVDAAEAVMRSGGSTRSRQAHFVGVLKSKARANGVDEETFLTLVRRIEIPNEIWHSSVAGVR